jgi:hypothetical protein
MAGLDPAIHVLNRCAEKGVDGRDEGAYATRLNWKLLPLSMVATSPIR